MFVFRVDSSFRRSFCFALFSAIVALLSPLISFTLDLLELSLAPGLPDLTSLVFPIVGGVLAIGSLWFAVHELQKYAHQRKNYEYFAVPHDSIPSEGSEIEINKLSPSQAESLMGFERIQPPGTDEIAFSSLKLNTWLSGQPSVQVDLKKSVEGIMASSTASKELQKERISYLRTLVLKGTINEKKYRIDSLPNPESKKIAIRKVGYFDAMVTNQCVNLRLRDRPQGTDLLGGEVADLRTTFPLVKENDGGNILHCLAPYGSGPMLANSVGISTLAVSADGFPVFFYQKIKNVEGGGRITAFSGSADYDDIAASRSRDFLDIVKFSMVREAMEEGSLVKRRDAKKIRSAAIEQTMVIGFFRWVRRGGKPEFLGLTRLNLTLNEIEADHKEVADLHGHKPIQLIKLSDFSTMFHLLNGDPATKKPKENITLGLSSAMVIWRLAQIADSKSEADAPLKSRICELLSIENA